MLRFLLLTAFLIGCFIARTQCLFSPDEYGYVSDPKFHQLIKERGYELVETFITWKNRTVEFRYCTVYLNNKQVILDCNGKEFPNLDALKNEKISRTDWYNLEDDTKVYTYVDPPKFELVRKDKKMGVRLYNRELLPVTFDSIEVVSSWSTLIVKKGKKKGVYDSSGKILIPIVYDQLACFKGHSSELAYYAYTKTTKSLTLFNSSGQVVLKGIKGDLVFGMTDRSVMVYSERKNPDRVGLMDHQGKRLTETVFTKIEPLKDKLYRVVGTSSLKTGVLNSNAELLLDTVFLSIYDFNKDLLQVNDDSGNSGLYDISVQKMTLPCKYHFTLMTGRFNGMPYIKVVQGDLENKTYGLVLANGTEILPMKYPSLEKCMSDTLFIAQKDSLFGVIDIQGKEFLSFKFETLNYIQPKSQYGRILAPDSLFYFTQNELLGVVNMDSEIIIKPLYKEIKPYKGFWIVKKGTEIELLDNHGNLVQIMSGSHFITNENGKILTGYSDKEFTLIYDLYRNYTKP